MKFFTLFFKSKAHSRIVPLSRTSLHFISVHLRWTWVVVLQNGPFSDCAKIVIELSLANKHSVHSTLISVFLTVKLFWFGHLSIWGNTCTLHGTREVLDWKRMLNLVDLSICLFLLKSSLFQFVSNRLYCVQLNLG